MSGYGTYILESFTSAVYCIEVKFLTLFAQLMLDICSTEAESLNFPFNTVKSVALRNGPRYRHECTALSLIGANLA